MMPWQILATSVVGSALFFLAGFWTLRSSQGGASRVIGRAGIGVGVAILVLGVTLAILVVSVDSNVVVNVTSQNAR